MCSEMWYRKFVGTVSNEYLLFGYGVAAIFCCRFTPTLSIFLSILLCRTVELRRVEHVCRPSYARYFGCERSAKRKNVMS